MAPNVVPMVAPAAAVKSIICAEVRRVVFEHITGDEQAGKACFYVNGVACGVLAALDPERRIGWRLRAGSATVDTGASDAEGPLAVGYDFEAGRAEGRAGEFHVWTVGYVGPEPHAVDFTIPDFEQVALRLGMQWLRIPPAYAWGNAAELYRDGAWYQSHPIATADVERVVAAQAPWLAQMTEEALAACNAYGIERLYY
jgi:hypothetical protein